MGVLVWETMTHSLSTLKSAGCMQPEFQEVHAWTYLHNYTITHAHTHTSRSHKSAKRLLIKSFCCLKVAKIIFFWIVFSDMNNTFYRALLSSRHSDICIYSLCLQLIIWLPHLQFCRSWPPTCYQKNSSTVPSVSRCSQTRWRLPADTTSAKPAFRASGKALTSASAPRVTGRSLQGLK